MGAIDSTPTGDFRATITDASGREVLSFNLSDSDRYILCSDSGAVTNRKLDKGDQYWSRATLIEVIREMTPKN